MKTPHDLPRDLEQRYRFDAPFHNTVSMIVQWLDSIEGNPHLSVADFREASMVAVEIKRVRDIRLRVQSAPGPIDP